MTTIKSILFSVFVLFALSSVSNAQLVVVKKPIKPKVVVVKTAKPGKNFAWIEGHWKVSGNKHIWIKGHWKRTRHGWIWVAGYWR